ncbi:MAG TPA: hypothetical protein VGC72_08620 [Candidatus Elarobacter sp.]|jgi:hypothetical protein
MLKRRIISFAALVLCAGFFWHGAQRGGTEYFVWAQLGSGGRQATFAFDSALNERSVLEDPVIAARHSADRLRFRFVDGHVYVVGDTLRRAPCDVPPSQYVFAPSGSRYACIDGNFPHAVVKVYRTHDHRALAEFTLPAASPDTVYPIAFLNEDSVLFTALHPYCPKHYSIDVMSIGRHFPPRTYMRCAAGVIVGTRRVAYLRGTDGKEYSLDGKTWVAQALYGLDADDRPITDDSPLIRKLITLHPGALVGWLSVQGSH